MPTYQYKCQSCNHRFEVVQSMTEDAIRACENCRGEVYRVIGTSVGIAFKGSGFYINDAQSSSESNTTSSKTA